MRTHRYSGAVAAALIGVGVVTQRPAPQNLTNPSGTAGAGGTLSSSALADAVQQLPGADAPWRTDLLRLPAHDPATGTLVAMTASLSPVPQLPPPPPPPPPVVVVPATQAASHAPAPQAPAAPAPVTTSVSSGPAPASGSAWASLRQCESGGNYSADTGNGYYGAYQFSASTWHGLGYGGLPSQASPSTQDAAAQALYNQRGWSPWPSCAASLGLG